MAPGHKLVTGNRGRRPIPAVPAFAPGTNLAPPRRWKAGGPEREEWGRIVPELQRLGIAKSVHQGLLELICELYAASAALFRKGHVTSARAQAAEYRKALSEFGLTAASAGRVSGTPDDGEENPADQFFSGPRLAK
jgi:hypothetical protein